MANSFYNHTDGAPATQTRGISKYFRDQLDAIALGFDGVAASSSVQNQWVTYAPTATFISTTSFSVAGNQTGTFEIGRRLKTTNTGGTIYSVITNSVFGVVTTVTLTNDSGVLDIGLSAVALGLLTASNPSIPTLSTAVLPVVPVAKGGTGAITAAAARTALGSTTVGDAVFIAATAAAGRTALGAAATADLAASGGSALVGHLPDGTGAIATTVENELNRTIWLNNYAVADNATNSVTGLTNAMAALPAEGGTLYYSGIFYFASIVVIAKRIKLVAMGGSGDGTLGNLPSSYWRFSSGITVGPLVQIQNHGSQWDGLHIEGGGKGVNTAVDNIQFLGSNHSVIRGRSWKAGRDGAKVGTGMLSVVICNNGIVGDFIGFENGAKGWHMDNNTSPGIPGNNANAWDIGGLRTYNNTGDGTVFDHADLNTLTGHLSETNTGWGLSILNGNFNTIVGGDREANTAGQFRILGSRAGGNGTNTSNYTSVNIANPTELVDADIILPTCTTVRTDRNYLLQGTFTPTFTGSTSGSHAAYTVQQGHWHRQGDMVFGSIALQATGALSGPVGNLEISGLDYTLPSGFTNGFFGISLSQYNGLTFGAGLTQLMGRVDANTSKVKLILGGSATAVGFLPVSGAGSNAQVYLSFFYPVVDI